MSSITRTTPHVTRLFVGLLTLLALVAGAIAVPAHAAPASPPAAAVSAAASNDNIVTGGSCKAGKTKVNVSANWDNVTNDGHGYLDYVVINSESKKIRKADTYWDAFPTGYGNSWVTKVNTKKKHVYRADPNQADTLKVKIHVVLTNGKDCYKTLYTD